MCSMTAYIDDSGTAPEHKVAIASALIIPAGRIVALEREWDTLKGREGFSDFHMAVFSSKNPEFVFSTWDDAKRERVYRRVREITKKYGVKSLSFAVFKKDYDEVVPADLRRHSGQHHYSWAVRHLVDACLGWRLNNGVERPLEYVFDWMDKKDPRKKEIEAVMDQQETAATQVGRAGEFKHFGFRPREEIPGLQCADVLAWISYQYALFVFCNKPLYPDAQLGWDDFHNCRTHDGERWRIAGTLKRSELEG